MADSATAPPGRWWTRYFPALGHRAFRGFLYGQAVSVVGWWMQQAAQGWYVQELTRDRGSEFWLGLTSAMSSLPIALFSPLGGATADRLPKRWLILATQTCAMLLAFTFGTLVAFGLAPLWSVILFAAMNGLCLSFDIPSRQAFAVEMVGRRDLLSAIALNSAVFNVGRLLGPMTAGLAISAFGIATCFYLNALSYIPVIAALAWMVLPARPPVIAAGPERHLWLGFTTVWRNPRLLGLLGTLSTVLMTGGAYLALMPALAQNVLGLDAGGYSVLLTANGLGGLFGALIVASRATVQSRRTTILLGIVLLGVGLVFLALSWSMWTAAPCLVVAGTGLVMFLSSTNSTVQLSISDAVRGRVMGVWVLVFGISQPIGSYLCGTIAYRIGTPRTLFLEGLICLLAILPALWVLRQPHIDPNAD